MIHLTHKLKNHQSPVTTLTLPWEKRIRSRLRVVLDNGAEAGLFLPRGTVLHDGDLLVSDRGDVVRICAADEALSTVTGHDPLTMARACYHLGNRHTPLEIDRDRIRYLHDPVLDEMIRGLGLDVRHDQAPFDPEAGAYGGGHHHHA
ncbi:urease accessory protein UreE [Desulfosarcina ovata subsp. sediminis]|uniref:Urease accessory protein UreE n=1 Tax=Desulfosarcina ovata subsp. sediminis TaxID=885957 RepID=A0A5K7ZPS3_9BACT|nr:urease accessory protein UreE [Desulfosarcina ovata]BBO82727.1 urease accessory protein UreE [Desulfosarcina ovata subsp. sediminis]